MLAVSLSANAGWYAKGRILVEPQNINEQEFDAILNQNEAFSLDKIPGLNTHVVILRNNQDEKAAADRLSRHPNIKYATVDTYDRPATINDPLVGNEWFLNKIEAPTAWGSSTGSGVIVAVIDTGVNPNHPDLAAQLVPGWNFWAGTSDTSDNYGHGTMVAGVIGAIGNNFTGVIGVAYDAKIMPIRISDNEGWAYWSTIAAGLTWAADHGAKVANISYSVYMDPTVQSAARHMRALGGNVYVSAGNTAADSGYGDNTDIVAVSATDQNDNLTSFSSFGSYVDMSAPGDYILTTTNDLGYNFVRGTSFSSPITAAVAALVRSIHPTFTSAQVDQSLFQGATDIGITGKDTYYGWGRVNALGAITASNNLIDPPPPPIIIDTSSPVVSITSPRDGTKISGNGVIKIAVNATDNIGVTVTKISIDGNTVATGNIGNLTYNWNIKKIASGNHVIGAYAQDAAGNSAIATITVIR
jgi:thermitase